MTLDSVAGRVSWRLMGTSDRALQGRRAVHFDGVRPADLLPQRW